MKRILLSVLLLAGQIAFAGANKNSPDLPQSGPQLVDVIVQFNPPAKGSSQGEFQKNVHALGVNNSQIKKTLDGINSVQLRVPASALPAIQAMPFVKYVSPSRRMKGALDITTQTVSANLAWNLGWTGAGVGVAVIDSGITPKHDLTSDGNTSRVVYSESFIDGMTDTTDDYGHGTHVAGIIGSRGIDSTGASFKRTFKGVAPAVNLINLRVLDANGGGMEADVIAGVLRAIALKDQFNIRVINLSIGRPVFESYTLDPICQAVEAAWKAGIVVVVAAGNDGRNNTMHTRGYGTINSPGNDPYVITVGATNANGTPSPYDDKVATYSSKGPTLVDHIVKPDLIAPGNSVVSVLAGTNATLYKYRANQVSDIVYDTTSGYATSANYLRLSGTSMATPVVAGAAALLLQKDPTLTPDQVKARLMKTTSKIMPRYSTGTAANSLVIYSNQSDVFTVGAGYLNISSALASNDRVVGRALSPMAVFNPISHRVRVVRASYGESVVWGDDTGSQGDGFSVVWGDSVVWGSAAFYALDDGFSVVWGDTVVWGDSLDDGFSVVWGDSLNLALSIQGLADDDGDLDQ